MSGYCRSTYITAVDRAAFEANIEDNRRALDEAAELGAACFVTVVGGLPEGSKDLAGARAQMVEGTGRLLEHAKAAGVALALEPLHPMYCADRACLSTLEQALDVCELLDPGGSGSIGVAVDVYHVWWDPALETQIARAGKRGRLLAFHVCDWLVPTRDLLLDRGMMGDGVVDIAQHPRLDGARRLCRPDRSRDLLPGQLVEAPAGRDAAGVRAAPAKRLLAAAPHHAGSRSAVAEILWMDRSAPLNSSS